jgi:hypothetical protein
MVTVTAAAAITNVQHAGVDEGDIVKMSGRYLVVLRRGRLFTIDVAAGSLQPVSTVDAFGPDVDPEPAWYDEMLVSDRRVVVIGYSYKRGGTELGLFDLGRNGSLRYRATYELRSNDYYSSRNYASRLVGGKLIFYAPLSLSVDDAAPQRSLPGLRRWRPGATEQEFNPIYSAKRIYRPVFESQDPTLHTVTTCDLEGSELACTAAGVIGPPGEVFYVSPASVYVWMTEWSSKPNAPSSSLLYRLPLDDNEPGAVRVSGAPIDQFSFLEEGPHLNVLVRAQSRGDRMWAAESTEGDVGLLRLPLAAFAREVEDVPAERYRPLPRPKGDDVQNRFVGRYVLFGVGSGWGEPDLDVDRHLFAYRYAEEGEPIVLELDHPVDRIEALGRDAIVVGADSHDLYFSSVALGDHPAVTGGYRRPGATQGEERSHGFFYKPEGDHAGMLGLPIRGPGLPGYEHLFESSASLVFLRNDALRLVELGELVAHPAEAADDDCRASCVDWYGNSRPLFLGDRILALLGYEIVEGQLSNGRIEELRRVSFAPAAARANH